MLLKPIDALVTASLPVAASVATVKVTPLPSSDVPE
jgi:hypothetical protein